MTQSTDRIERSILLRAPRERVWRALSDAKEFGEWFGAILEGAFEPGARVRGRVTYPGYEHVRMEIVIERMVPMRTISWRWHPDAVEPGVDYSAETPTLVEFTLEEAAGGTKLTVVESGFDRIPPGRREKAYRDNSQGWEIQMENIGRHVHRAS
jgi:uncharacterized protein YndB with AHSA1/START domain